MIYRIGSFIKSATSKGWKENDYENTIKNLKLDVEKLKEEKNEKEEEIERMKKKSEEDEKNIFDLRGERDKYKEELEKYKREEEDLNNVTDIQKLDYTFYNRTFKIENNKITFLSTTYYSCIFHKRLCNGIFNITFRRIGTNNYIYIGLTDCSLGMPTCGESFNSNYGPSIYFNPTVTYFYDKSGTDRGDYKVIGDNDTVTLEVDLTSSNHDSDRYAYFFINGEYQETIISNLPPAMHFGVCFFVIYNL